jgi:hypothetical protein
MAKYRVQDSVCGDDFEAADDDAALAYGEKWLREGDWNRSETIFLEAEVVQLQDDGEFKETLGHVRVTLSPEEPKCSAGSHDWCSPYELVGGMKENPGVFSNGGGVRIREVCKHCGVSRVTDTWATNRCDGTQGHETVEYFPAGEEELEWVEQQQEEDR